MIAFFVFALALIAAAQGQPIIGIVLDATGRPIVDAYVCVTSGHVGRYCSDRTGDGGRFEIADEYGDLPAGPPQLFVLA